MGRRSVPGNPGGHAGVHLPEAPLALAAERVYRCVNYIGHRIAPRTRRHTDQGAEIPQQSQARADTRQQGMNTEPIGHPPLR